MTLLAAITSSSPAAAANHPVVLTPGAPPPSATTALPAPIDPADWALAPADPALATAASFLAVSLSADALTAPRFRALLGSFLTTLSRSLALPAPPAKLLPAVRAAAPYLPATLAPLLASSAARLAEYDVLLALTETRALPHPPQGLLAALDAAARPDLLCAVLRQAADLRSAELLAALRCFLCPASDRAYDSMVAVKTRWKEAALAVANMAVDELRTGAQVTRRAAILLMMGHDGFTSPEVCLHYLFASRNVEDPLVLAAAVSELDGGEVASLLRYLAKWVGKYSRFPEAQPCPEAVEIHKLEQCDSVPSLVAVARAMGLVLDQHFSHIVLNAELRQDLLAAGVMAKELAAEAEAGPILDLLRRMPQAV
ncbi:uncharacterized protein LOC119266615 [Triticum dicoccoides]|uniref:uncharacterized protein LOC119266615 n=1 Tax=Triticum dicoccoides TaxID=85692 RepID=UPI00188E7C32|nr:uncharacterized protein LOC119266615 [Triticum dicoccoides]